MTRVLTPVDTAEAVAGISQRLYRLEQLVSSPRVMGGGGEGGSGGDPDSNFPDGITVGGIPIDSISDPPTGLILTTGAFMEDIYIDASWTAPAGTTNISGYDVEIAKKVGGVYELVQVRRVGGTSTRWNALQPQVTYGVRIATINRIGVRSDYLGFQDITTGIDATLPAQVSGVQISAAFHSVVITWNEVADRDVARGSGQYLVELAGDAGFSAGYYRAKHTTGTITSFTDLPVNTTFYTRVTAVDNSGNSGPVSAVVSATTGQITSGDIGTGAVGTTHIQAAAITNALIANLAVDNAKIADLSAAKITAGTLSADRIAANSLDVEKLASSTMTTVNLTLGASGAIKVGTPPTTGLLINSQGLRLYSGGVVKVTLDSTGNASFEGSISASTVTGTTITGGSINGATVTGGIVRTASAGNRVQMESGELDRIKWYTGHADETAPAHMNVGTSPVHLESGWFGPKSTGSYFGGIRLGTKKSSQSGQSFVDIGRYDGVGGGMGAAKGRITIDTDGTWGDSVRVDACAIFQVLASTRTEIYVSGAGTGAGRVVINDFDDVTTVLSIRSPNGTVSGSLCAYAGAPGKLLINDESGNTRIDLECADLLETSAASSKRNIQRAPGTNGAIGDLEVVTFNRPKIPGNEPYPGDDATHWGFTAEQVFGVFPEAVALDREGRPAAIRMGTMLGLLVKAVQELEARISNRP